MSDTANQIQVRDNRDAQRFEAEVDSHLCVAEYQRGPETITFTHTEVPQALGGRGIGGQLARACLNSAREQGLQVVPLCSFIAGYIDKHPEYQDLLQPKR